VYYIDWKDIQLYVVNGFGYNTNAGSARSRGVELSFEAKPATGLTIASWLTWNSAELSEDFPAGSSLYGASGDRLPYSSRFSSNLSVEQQFPVGTMTGMVGGSLSYVGGRLGGFSGAADAARQRFAGYARTDLQAALMSGPWTATLFANNVFDRRGVLEGGLDFFPSSAFIYIQPRTVGISVARSL
jgi:outer membrane receptor protein involved in Fe transport